jgi:hypothetical protein
MASIDLYVPVYMEGANGKKAYQFAKVAATVTNAQVPEGELCLKSSTLTTTPTAALQPPATNQAGN